MKRILISILTLAVLSMGVVALAKDEPPKASTAAAPAAKVSDMSKAAHDGHVMKMSELTWTDAEGYATGVKVAAVCAEGGATSAYVKFPAGTKVAAHTHPANHWGSVIMGTGTFGFGTDPTKGMDFGPGSYLHVPAKTQHWLTAKTEVLVFVASHGPEGIDYVNPSDDPRKGQAISK
jgi:quercetin dioxygenase-like cupin family protein